MLLSLHLSRCCYGVVRTIRTGHFTTWEALRTTFLDRFQQEKTLVQLLKKLYTLKQEQKEHVVEYAGRLKTLYNRIDATSNLTRAMLVGWFVAGLRKEFRGISSKHPRFGQSGPCSRDCLKGGAKYKEAKEGNQEAKGGSV